MEKSLAPTSERSPGATRGVAARRGRIDVTAGVVAPACVDVGVAVVPHARIARGGGVRSRGIRRVHRNRGVDVDARTRIDVGQHRSVAKSDDGDSARIDDPGGVLSLWRRVGRAAAGQPVGRDEKRARTRREKRWGEDEQSSSRGGEHARKLSRHDGISRKRPSSCRS